MYVPMAEKMVGAMVCGGISVSGFETLHVRSVQLVFIIYSNVGLWLIGVLSGGLLCLRGRGSGS